LIFERKNDQVARRAEYLQNIKKHIWQSIHKIGRIRYSKVSTKYKHARTAKYSQNIEKNVGQSIKKLNLNLDTKNGKIHFVAYFVTERQAVTKNEANKLS